MEPAGADAPMLDRGEKRRWGVALAVLVVDAFWLAASGRAVAPQVLYRVGGCVLFLAALIALMRLLARRKRTRAIAVRLRYPEVAATIEALLLLLVFFYGMNVLSYLCVALGGQLLDERLVHLDRALGFSWPEGRDWVRARPALTWLLRAAYGSGLSQLLLIPAVLGIAGQRRRVTEFVDLMMLASFATLVVATALPSSSAFLHFPGASALELATISHYGPLRAGTLRVFDLARLQGLVSLPSFHALLGVFFVYVLRERSLLFAASAVLNVAMIVSTVTEGGHYLIDVLAGLALAAAVILIRRACSSRRIAMMPS